MWILDQTSSLLYLVELSFITGKVELVEFHQACTMVGGTTVYHSPTIEESIPQVQPKSGNEIDAFLALKIKKCYFEQDD